MSSRKLGALIAAPLITIIVLTGCVQGGNQTPGPGPSSPTSTSAPQDPTASPNPDDGLGAVETGAVLTDEQVAALRGIMDDGMTVYTLPNGDRLLVRANEPLPPAVQADAEAKADALPISGGDSIDAQLGTIKGGESVASQISVSTGKRVVVITSGTIVFAAEGYAGFGWLAAGIQNPARTTGGVPGGLKPHGADRAAVIAEVEALIAAKPDAANWVIVVQG